MEGVERDSDGEDDGGGRERVPTEDRAHSVEVRHREGGVLEHRQHGEVHANGKRQQQLRRAQTGAADAVDRDGHPVVEGHRGQHQPREDAAPFGIEQQRRAKQDQVGGAAVRPLPADQEEQERQKQEEKGRFSKEHEGRRPRGAMR